MTDWHTGYAYITNDWGADLASITLRHRRGNDPDLQEERTWDSVPAGSNQGPMQFAYETGFGSPFDYWWVKLTTTSNQVYQCKDVFYCSVSPSDDGNVYLTVDAASEELRVKFSESDGCKVAMERPS